MQRSSETATGFTLIEVMVSLSLGMLLLAGAFVMHSSYARQSNRQQQLADMQQALRVGRDIVARAVRGAAAGSVGVPFHIWDCTSGQDRYFYPVQFGNDNNELNLLAGLPKTVFDTNATDVEAYPNPDWLRIITVRADPESSTPGTSAAVQSFNKTTGVLGVSDVRPFTVGQMVYVDNRAATDNTVGGINPIKAKRRHLICARRVTAKTPLGPCVGPACPCTGNSCGTLTFGGDCANPAVGADDCLNAIVLNPTAIVFSSDQSVTFRVDLANPTTPKLMASYTPPGVPPKWQVLSENIEDLQVAFIYNDGTICGNGAWAGGPTPVVSNSIDGPVDALVSGAAPCNFVNLREVRFTLTARSSSLMSGFTSPAGPSLEDEASWPPVAGIGPLRRVMTTTVQLRNPHL